MRAGAFHVRAIGHGLARARWREQSGYRGRCKGSGQGYGVVVVVGVWVELALVVVTVVVVLGGAYGRAAVRMFLVGCGGADS